MNQKEFEVTFTRLSNKYKQTQRALNDSKAFAYAMRKRVDELEEALTKIANDSEISSDIKYFAKSVLEKPIGS